MPLAEGAKVQCTLVHATAQSTFSADWWQVGLSGAHLCFFRSAPNRPQWSSVPPYTCCQPGCVVPCNLLRSNLSRSAGFVRCVCISLWVGMACWLWALSSYSHHCSTSNRDTMSSAYQKCVYMYVSVFNKHNVKLVVSLCILCRCCNAVSWVATLLTLNNMG